MTQDARNETMRVDARNHRSAYRQGFTLIEILVVIIIIGILAALLVPAIGGAVRRAKTTAIKMEVEGLSQAIERYNQEYGDYPPDFSRWDVVQRHFERIFPQISNDELRLLEDLCGPSGTFDPTAVNRAEALVLTLGGYSKDKKRPLTGQGGPLELINPNGGYFIANVQYNTDRDSPMFEFETKRLTLETRPNGLVRSTDDGDALPVYVPSGRLQPFVYFDSRTYGIVGRTSNGPVFNGYWGGDAAGGVRPYKTTLTPEFPKPPNSPYGNIPKALDAYHFQNPDKFQVISAGLDDIYGSLVFTNQPNSLDGLPVYFLAETGVAVFPNEDASRPEETRFGNINGFQDGDFSQSISENGQLDNVTNFSNSTLESDLVEEI